ncbi:MAG: hypothetical protein ACXVQQ_01185 [Gaiellaceae bacterium]
MRVMLLSWVFLALLVPVAASATGRSHVRLMTFSPLVVRGTGFKAHEEVVVTVRSGSASRVARVNSSATGTFTARFARTLPGAACRGVAVSAVGALGDRAAWKSPPQVCGTPLAP